MSPHLKCDGGESCPWVQILPHPFLPRVAYVVMSRIVTPTNQVRILTRGFLICLIGPWRNGSAADFDSAGGSSILSGPVFST